MPWSKGCRTGGASGSERIWSRALWIDDWLPLVDARAPDEGPARCECESECGCEWALAQDETELVALWCAGDFARVCTPAAAVSITVQARTAAQARTVVTTGTGCSSTWGRALPV